MAFGPDIHVFPGGRVDAADVTPAAPAGAGLSREAAASNLGVHLGSGGDPDPDMALALHAAAVRETLEETGIRIVATDLIPLSRWVTPPSMARRFDARFFAAIVGPGTRVGRPSAEVVEARWLTPGAALGAAQRGEIELWQPTFVTLQQLDGLADEVALRSAFALGRSGGGPVLTRLRPDLVRVEATWAGGIPGRRATGWLVGRRDVLVVDPADPTGVTSDAIIAAVAGPGGRLAGVVISSLAPERHAGVEMFAHGLGLPVAGPRAAARAAPYPLIALDDGELLPFGDGPVSLGRALRPG
jgi:8-oxo-dGTP pyrophosphatase MutT (NUDIX family)